MPLVYKASVAQGTFLGIWKKEETFDFLQNIYPLHSEEKPGYEKINNIQRKGEWLATRVLLTEMLEKRKTITYSEHGKPGLLHSNFEISISHSKNFVAILLSKIYKVGIDVEHLSERVRNVQHKFLTDEELQWCKTIKQLTLCWSAKESVFKIFEKGLDFKNIQIAPFECGTDKGQFVAVVREGNFSNNFTVHYLEIEEDVLTFTYSNLLSI